MPSKFTFSSIKTMLFLRNVRDNLAPLPDEKPKTEPAKKVHLFSPEEFLHSPSKMKNEMQAENLELGAI